MVVVANRLVVVKRAWTELNVVFRVVVAVVSAVVAKLARVMGVRVPLATLKTRWQDITQGELIFNLADSFHISNYLKSTAVHQAEASRCLLLVGCVGHLASKAGVNP
jgi:hypothetical protein